MKSFIMSIRITIICLFIIVSVTLGEVRLPRLVSDGMVLQQDAQVKVWGWADAGEKIT